jgi:hypothetical protein
MLAEERRDQFKSEVANAKLRTDQSRTDGWSRVAGLVLMAVGVVGAFLVYNVSLSQDDPRDIASGQILATALGILAVAGAGLYVAGAVSRLLRLWLLRQLVESQAHVDQISDALQQTRR